ncbi:MAG: TraX family protein [Candidatus Limivicinus sp.]
MSVFVLKLLALVSMMIDHTAYFLRANSLIAYDPYDLMRSIGRIAFPIYCFLLVNGFDKTSNRRRYLSRLLLFAALSQIPFTLLFEHGSSFSLAQPVLSLALAENGILCLAAALCGLAAYALLAGPDRGLFFLALFYLCGSLRLSLFGVTLLGDDLNVFYTLSFGLAGMMVLEALFYDDVPLYKSLPAALILLISLLLFQPAADYAWQGLALLGGLWLCRRSRPAQLAVIALWCWWMYRFFSPLRLYFSLLSLLPVLLYNGKKGPGMKLGFYAAYPLHLLVLGIGNLLL